MVKLPIIPDSSQDTSFQDSLREETLGEEAVSISRQKYHGKVAEMHTALTNVMDALEPILQSHASLHTVSVEDRHLRDIAPDDLEHRERTAREDMEALLMAYQSQLTPLQHNLQNLLDGKKPPARLAESFRIIVPKQLRALEKTLGELVNAKASEFDFTRNAHQREKLREDIQIAFEVIGTELTPRLQEFCDAAARYADTDLYLQENAGTGGFALKHLGTTNPPPKRRR